MLMENFDPRRLSAPTPGLYTCISSPFSKIFFSKTAWPIKALSYVESTWEGEMKVYINGPGHKTKMAASHIYGKKTSKILSYSINSPMTMKLGMEYYVFMFNKVYINDDPEFTLTYFTTMSNLAKLVFVLIVGPDIR